MEKKPIGNTVKWFGELKSTNDYATSIAHFDGSHGIVIASEFQSQGRGQRGNQWESEKGENLLFSIVLHPRFLEVRNQFLLSKAIALSLCDVLSVFTNGVSIKWPNDIYIGNKKVAGILIEHSFSSIYLDTTIIGVGLNVNQSVFLSSAPNPTSLYLEFGQNFDIAVLLNSVCNAFNKRYAEVEANQYRISENYLQNLFRYEVFHKYRALDQMFTAKIIGVRNSGELMLQTIEGERLEFAFKEIEYVL
ncbi:MAG TPA: biotin--[acetyl-CoA-carboxylase] ligase [Bacteroidales bacterium]|jgi:BirA family biotin operon repressor/biotin-[acetyl-CoA-carboxylase] ligase|nr:biotin--[acetyl-CoA-carboxylase] ligase [Bacteroidales bacterium]